MTDAQTNSAQITVSPDMIGLMFPHLAEDQRAMAIEFFAAAQPFRDALSKIERVDYRSMMLQQWSGSVIQAINMLAQK